MLKILVFALAIFGANCQLNFGAIGVQEDQTATKNQNVTYRSGQNNLSKQPNGIFCCCATSVCPIGPSVETSDEPSSSDEFEPRREEIPKEVEKRSDEDSDEEEELDIRIINTGLNDNKVTPDECQNDFTKCCYTSEEFVNQLEGQCVKPTSDWTQKCQQKVPRTSERKCGERNFTPLPNLKVGDASPEEFPWTCLILTENDDFVAGCAIIPEKPDNDIAYGTKRVITVAHRLSVLKPTDKIKIRVLEYDARGFAKGQEKQKFQEYDVSRILKHPKFDSRTLYNDIALLLLRTPINLVEHNGINAACIPACEHMFDHRFPNGTGTRCWVAGWGKSDYEGNFSFIQRKADVPIFDRNRCDRKLGNELSKTNGPRSKNFQLQPGEICAGGEEGKDACNGDGGAPMVCQSHSGLWHVVGLVAWGINCGKPGIPGVYVNVYHYYDFINQRP